MKIAAQKIIPTPWGPMNWLTLVGDGGFPESCDCEDAAEFPPTIIDETKDYGWLLVRNFMHKRTGQRDETLTKRCVCAMTKTGKPISWDQYVNRDYSL